LPYNGVTENFNITAYGVQYRAFQNNRSPDLTGFAGYGLRVSQKPEFNLRPFDVAVWRYGILKILKTGLGMRGREVR
jgi:hypothetical protein